MTLTELHGKQKEYRDKLLALHRNGLSYLAIAKQEGKEKDNIVKMIRRARKDDVANIKLRENM